MSAALAFTLTPEHEAGAPPEARGLERDEVRLLVARRDRPALVHDTLPRPARAPARRRPARGQHLRHDPRRAARHPRRRHRRRPPPLDPGPGRRRSVAGEGRRRARSRRTPRSSRWVVELRRGGARFRSAGAGERLTLPAGGSAELVASYLSPGRLWIAALDLPLPLDRYLAEHGRPIAYGHLARPRPLRDLQTVFADEPGSAEMPSAGRPFTQRVLDDLFARGVQVAPLVLHTGVASLERGERPYPERYRVPRPPPPASTPTAPPAGA